MTDGQLDALEQQAEAVALQVEAMRRQIAALRDETSEQDTLGQSQESSQVRSIRGTFINGDDGAGHGEAGAGVRHGRRGTGKR